jgi:hypothetical protein
MTPVLVLYISPYDFNNDQGERVAGLTLEYLELDQDPNDHAREGTKGLTVFKDTLEPEAVRDFTAVPGLYELSHRKARDAKGKQSLRVSGGKLVGKVDLAKLATPKVASPNN